MTVNRTAIHGIILWIVAIAAIITGYYLSTIRFLDQDWLSRAGCLIVVLGIWSGFGGLIEEKILHRGLRIRKFMAMRRVRMAFGADTEEMEKQIQQIQDKFSERLEELRHKLGISVGAIEASLLITGTLLWGFGDLLKYI